MGTTGNATDFGDSISAGHHVGVFRFTKYKWFQVQR